MLVRVLELDLLGGAHCQCQRLCQRQCLSASASASANAFAITGITNCHYVPAPV